MNIKIKATNIELTEAISNYANRRILSIQKFVKEIESEILVYIEVGKTTNHHKQGEVFRAEINIDISGSKFYSFSEKEDLYIAIDDAIDEIIRQIKNQKNKKQTLFKRGAKRLKEIIRGMSKD